MPFPGFGSRRASEFNVSSWHFCDIRVARLTVRFRASFGHQHVAYLCRRMTHRGHLDGSIDLPAMPVAFETVVDEILKSWDSNPCRYLVQVATSLCRSCGMHFAKRDSPLSPFVPERHPHTPEAFQQR